MTSQNPTGNDPKNLTTPPADAAPKAGKPSESKRELTDDEIAAVAGGHAVTGGGHSTNSPGNPS